MKPVLLILIALITCLKPQAQQRDYAKGFIITAAGDTILGQINWKKNFGSRDLIYIKKAGESTPTPLALDEIRSLHNTESKKSVLVVKLKVKFEYVDPIELNLIYNDSVKTLHLPLKPLYIGASLSLYVYHEKTDYFFLIHDGQIEQLVKEYELLTDHERLVHTNRILPAYYSYNTWKVQLYGYYNFNIDKKMYNLSLDAKFEEYYLAKLVSRMDKALQGYNAK